MTLIENKWLEASWSAQHCFADTKETPKVSTPAGKPRSRATSLYRYILYTQYSAYAAHRRFSRIVAPGARRSNA